MESTPVSPEPVAPGAESPLGRVAGIFFAPARTFASIARKPGWVAPLLIATVLSVLATVVLLPRMDFEASLREGLAARDEAVSEEQIERMVEGQKRFAPLVYVWGVLAPTVITLLLAGVFWLSFKAFGWDHSYKQSLGVTSHAYLPNCLAAILLAVFAMRLESFNPADLGDLVRSNPAFLVDRRASPVLHSLLQSFDVFSLWALALLVIGYSIAAKVSRGKAAAIIVSLWGLYVLGKAGFTAIFS
ncbi:MAG TPA: Yip1 family protein [Thermoanaerobaculia bacterium]|nr:Yip1 family protein [Thermoanaerobaculia bacterium]